MKNDTPRDFAQESHRRSRRPRWLRWAGWPELFYAGVVVGWVAIEVGYHLGRRECRGDR